MLALAAVVGAFGGDAVANLSVSAGSTYQVGARRQNPYQAQRLAQTYARLLTEEPGVLRAVVAQTHMSETEVRQRLSMVAEPHTAVVVATLSARTPAVAVAGVRALSRALRSDSDSAGSKIASFLTPLSVPETTTSSFTPKRAMVLGAFLALVLSFALIVAIERRTPRIDDLDDLAELLSLPVSQVSRKGMRAASDVGAAALPSEVDDPSFVLVSKRRRARRTLAPSASNAQPLLSLKRWASGLTDITDKRPCDVLLVTRGTPAIEVERASRTSLASGRRVVGALLVVRRRSVGLRGIDGG